MRISFPLRPTKIALCLGLLIGWIGNSSHVLAEDLTVSPMTSLTETKVYEKTDNDTLLRWMADPNVTAYMKNALNDMGVASGQADPVLIRLLTTLKTEPSETTTLSSRKD